MRRISPLVVLFAVTSACVARPYVPARYKTRYSPYAWSYGRSGLVHGGVTYSPYAFSYGRTGLVYENVRYSPYAWRYGHSGLIADYCGAYAPCYFSGGPRYPDCVDYGKQGCAPHGRYPAVQSGAGCEARQAAPAPKTYAAAKAKPTPLNRQEEPAVVIRTFLDERNIRGYRITNHLRIGDKTLSVSFMLSDKNLIVTYWNPDAMDAAANQSESRKAYIERYKKNWESYCAEYQQSGGSVYAVNASGREEVLLGLDMCGHLDPDHDSIQPLLAVAQESRSDRVATSHQGTPR